MKNLTVLNLDLGKGVGNVRHAVRGIVLGGLIFVLQSCGVHYVSEIPVASVEVRPMSPYANAVWIDGRWAWQGGRHTYVGGYWDHPRRGRSYQAGEWRHSPRGHYWVDGRWR